MTLTNEAKNSIHQQLAALTGKNFQEDQIKQKGTELVLPENMTPDQAVTTLKEYIKDQEREQAYIHKTNYRYLDGLIALKRTMKSLTGMIRGAMTVQTLFGPATPPTINVQVGPDEWEEAVTGEIPIDLFEGVIDTAAQHDKEKGELFWLRVRAPAKYRNSIRGFFQLIDKQLEENSIYRGHAITGSSKPEYLDLSGVDPAKVTYSEEVMTQLNANVWSLLEHTDAMREQGLPLKRSVLLEGPYGTGKTLAAFLTAQRAVANNWTFIFVRPNKDNLNDAMATAQLYQPSVVFFEDIDTTGSPDTNASELLDVFDGIQAKGTEILAVLTTNHADRIHKGLVRPGRLDAVIHIGALDQAGIERLIYSIVPSRQLPKNLDMDSIYESMEGYMPAFVKEAIDRAIRYNLARNEGKFTQLSSDDFVQAGNGLRDQLNLMEGAREEFVQPTLDATLRAAVRNELGNFKIVTSPETMKLAEDEGFDWGAIFSENPSK